MEGLSTVVSTIFFIIIWPKHASAFILLLAKFPCRAAVRFSFGSVSAGQVVQHIST